MSSAGGGGAVDLPFNLGQVHEEALHELKRSGKPVPGGWPLGHGSKYLCARFKIGEVPWVVCRGHQEQEYARLLDATGGQRHKLKARYGLALLDPEKVRKHGKAPARFRRRFQYAALHALNIVCLEVDGEGTWDPEPIPTFPDLDIIAETVRRELIARATAKHPKWFLVAQANDSPAAELLIRPAVGTALAAYGFQAQDERGTYDAFWRRGITDGLWTRECGGRPLSIALEVKVGEDTEAPLCQAFDDLGEYDAVLYVRLLNEEKRRDIVRRAGMHAAQQAVQEKLPIRYLYVRFCAACQKPTQAVEIETPNLRCGTCRTSAT